MIREFLLESVNRSLREALFGAQRSSRCQEEDPRQEADPESRL